MQKRQNLDVDVARASEIAVFFQARYARRNGVGTGHDGVDFVATVSVGYQHAAQMKRWWRLVKITWLLFVVIPFVVRLPNFDDRAGQRRFAIGAEHAAAQHEFLAGFIVIG